MIKASLKESICPVILCGGAGTRLWPLSRAEYPKQLLALTGAMSLFQLTVRRVSGPDFASPVIVCNEAQRFLIADQLDELKMAPRSLWLEPEGRNTAPAIALAALDIARADPEALMLVVPADHVILDIAAFLAAVREAAPFAREGRIVTFGQRPTRAETGYGYIEAELSGGSVVPVARFVEKPDADTAATYVAGGRHHWNSGIFLLRADVYLEELERWAPELGACCASAFDARQQDGAFTRPGAAFLDAESKSIDYAIMERTERASVLPSVDMGWTDVGSWQAVWEMSVDSATANSKSGIVVDIDCTGSLFRSEDGPLIAVIGVTDLVVIATRDAVLVCPRDRSQEIRAVVDAVGEQDRELVTAQARVHRPWGTYETTDRGDRFQTKKIVVKPGGRLSLQKHHHRSEHWIVVRGTAEVTIGTEVKLIQENESTYIPAGTTHRLANPGKIPLELIEVQCGAYLGEDDIIRYEDNYGRTG